MNEECKNGNIEVVKYLFEKGVPIDANAIMFASMYGHLEILKYLFEKGAPIDEWAIYYASLNGASAIYHALDRSHLEIVKYLVSVNAPRFTQDSEKISVIIKSCREYRQELLTSLEYRLGHPSYIVLDYLEYSL